MVPSAPVKTKLTLVVADVQLPVPHEVVAVPNLTLSTPEVSSLQVNAAVMVVVATKISPLLMTTLPVGITLSRMIESVYIFVLPAASFTSMYTVFVPSLIGKLNPYSTDQP